MDMSFDQILQVIGTIGTWIAGVGAFAAVAAALWLARRVERVKLRCYVGLRTLLGAGISEDCLVFGVTNIGERAVIVDSVGWRIGSGKDKRVLFFQILTPRSPAQFPKRIEYAETASFMIYFSEAPNWIQEFSEKVVSDRDISTLRAQINTSVGHTVDVRPEENFLNKLRGLSVVKKR